VAHAARAALPLVRRPEHPHSISSARWFVSRTHAHAQGKRYNDGVAVSRRQVFTSFEYSDLMYATLPEAWSANENDDFGFYRERLRVAVSSRDADYIKSRLRPKIRRAIVLLCLIGDKTAQSSWVNWEIATAKEEGKGLVGVLIKPGLPRPREIRNARAVFVPYRKAKIQRAIDWAATAGKSGDWSYKT
jgi:hypothetical protein